MAEKETLSKPKDMIEPVPEEMEKVAVEENKNPKEKEEKPRRRRFREPREEQNNLDSWVPKTKLGRLVKDGKEKELDSILNSGRKILEPEIVDFLIRTESDLLLLGQAKGKFGGGKRRAWRQTQKKTMEGNIVTFSCMAVIGDRNGHVGIGMGKAKETLPARAKSFRQAKLNIIRIRRGFETKEPSGSKPHTVPYAVEGKCGSVRIKLIPAPRGTGLVVGDECKKILRLAGIEDVYAVTKGQTRTTFNVAKACINALKKTNEELLE